MGDLFLVRLRKRGWEVVRLPDGRAQRQVIARDVRAWSDVQAILDDAASHMGGYAWPEERRPKSDFFSLRFDPEPETQWQRPD